MNCIKLDLPTELKYLQIETFSDVHLGDKLIDWNLLTKRLKEVETNKNMYAILNGDLMDNATCASLGDTYEAELDPNEQVQKIVKLFMPIKDKILSVTTGNHEGRTKKQSGLDLTEMICFQLGIHDRYHPIGSVLFLRFGHSLRRKRKILYTIYHTHGRGGGRRPGSKANRLEDMMSIVDTDIYIHSHTHTPMVFKTNSFRLDNKNNAIAECTKLAVNTAAYLQYGGYGQVAEYKPTSRDNPVIWLNGTKKEFNATL